MGIPVHVPNLALAQMHTDAAAAGTRVARGFLDFGGLALFCGWLSRSLHALHVIRLRDDDSRGLNGITTR